VRAIRALQLLMAASVLQGCAAALVPETSDPRT
jgi:hypothetical protein